MIEQTENATKPTAATAVGSGDTTADAVTTAATTPPTPPTVAEGGTPVDGTSLSEEELAQLTDDIIAAIKTVYDPEIPVDIYELGLIYEVDVDDERNVAVEMTLTAPGCPVAGEMPIWVQNAISPLPGIQSVKVDLTFDPPWDPSHMSDEARLALNMF